MCFCLCGVPYISSSSEDLGEDHSGQTVSAVVQCGYSKFQHSILVLHRAQIQQAAKTKNVYKKKRIQTDNWVFTVSLIKCVLPSKDTKCVWEEPWGCFYTLTTETGHISPAVWLPVGVQRVSPGRGSSVGWVWWAGRYSADSARASALRMRTAMTPCPSPGPLGNPGRPGERTDRQAGYKSTKNRDLKNRNLCICLCTFSSNLVRVHEELNKLTANHSELSGLWVIQRQPCVQFTAGFIKVQQPPHKPAKKKKYWIIFQKVLQTTSYVFIGFDDVLLVHLFIFVVPEVYIWPLGEKNI